jgi:hypothetical protein
MGFGAVFFCIIYGTKKLEKWKRVNETSNLRFAVGVYAFGLSWLFDLIKLSFKLLTNFQQTSLSQAVDSYVWLDFRTLVLTAGTTIIAFFIPAGMNQLKKWKETDKYSHLNWAIILFMLSVYIFSIVVFYSSKIFVQT